MGIEILKGTVQ